MFNKNKQTLLNSFMKKLFALLLLPSIAFAGKIGENYVGVELGTSNIDFTYAEAAGSVSTDGDGFSWAISGNYNLYNAGTENYGLDLGLSYFNTSADDTASDTGGTKWTTDTDLSVFSLILRPYYDLGSFKIFADLGLFNQDIEIDIKHSSTDKASGDSSEFLYGVGFELDLGEKFSIQPSVAWTESPNLIVASGSTLLGSDTVTFAIPVSYRYSKNIDITASYSSVSNDDFVHSTTKTTKANSEPTSTLAIGIDYKF